MHACIFRQVADTLRSSVYQQILWSISALGLESEFNCTVSPLEITRVSTGQKIYFRGADDPARLNQSKYRSAISALCGLKNLTSSQARKLSERLNSRWFVAVTRLLNLNRSTLRNLHRTGRTSMLKFPSRQACYWEYIPYSTVKMARKAVYRWRRVPERNKPYRLWKRVYGHC